MLLLLVVVLFRRSLPLPLLESLSLRLGVKGAATCPSTAGVGTITPEVSPPSVATATAAEEAREFPGLAVCFLLEFLPPLDFLVSSDCGFLDEAGSETWSDEADEGAAASSATAGLVAPAVASVRLLGLELCLLLLRELFVVVVEAACSAPAVAGTLFDASLRLSDDAPPLLVLSFLGGLFSLSLLLSLLLLLLPLLELGAVPVVVAPDFSLRGARWDLFLERDEAGVVDAVEAVLSIAEEEEVEVEEGRGGLLVVVVVVVAGAAAGAGAGAGVVAVVLSIVFCFRL